MIFFFLKIHFFQINFRASNVQTGPRLQEPRFKCFKGESQAPPPPPPNFVTNEGTPLLRASGVGARRRRGAGQTRTERSQDAERSRRSLQQTQAARSHRDAPLARLSPPFPAFSRGRPKRRTRSNVAPISDKLERIDPVAEMDVGRLGAQTPGPLAPRSLLSIVLLLTCCLAVGEAFNLDVESPTVYSGPAGTYFGYAVDFYLVNPSR